MPIGNLAVEAGSDAVITVVATVGSGKLYADPAFGATVSGGGSSSLWITGTAAEITAKLATLVYAAGPVGADRLSIALLDPASDVTQTALVPIAILPFVTSTPELVSVSGGTVTLDAKTLDGVTLALSQPGADEPPTALVLVNTTLGARSALAVGGANEGAIVGPHVAIAGQVELAGSVRFEAGPALMSLALGAVATNDGGISFVRSAAIISGGGTLRNDGAIAVSGGSLSLNAAITGDGSITLAPDTTLTLAGPIAAGQTIQLAAADTLVLAAPATMRGTLSGFASDDTIILTGITADATSYRTIGLGHGLLTVYDGASVVASLDLTGVSGESFVLSRAAGSVHIALSAPAVQVGSMHFESPVEVYRFFDAQHGAELLTQDAAERDAIATARPDLIYEGVAMHALDASAPDAEAVFRFFDSVHGTQFFTASETERDTLLATRPDLVFEPGSTLYEHATQMAGDSPVFRFFDETAGTHFYTADAGERAQILATRTDFRDEGIAFYAPTH